MAEASSADKRQIVSLTGAAGRLGSTLRKSLSAGNHILRSCDLQPMQPLYPGEEVLSGDLASATDVAQMVKGADVVVHFGGVPEEDEFDKLLTANIIGNYNIFQQSLEAGVRRVIFASSNHATGYHPSGNTLDALSVPLPDTLYGVSKVYGEALGALYAKKYGMEVVCLRIGACWPKPRGDLRDLAVWLSHADLTRLVDACIDAPAFEFEILYGVSNNDRKWWDNTHSSIKYRPQDNSESYASELLPQLTSPSDAANPALRYQGGAFAADGYIAKVGGPKQ